MRILAWLVVAVALGFLVCVIVFLNLRPGEPTWTIRRELISAEGKPVADAKIAVECVHRQTVLQRFREVIPQTHFDLSSDHDGYFHLRTNADMLYFTISKDGFIPKRFAFFAFRDAPEMATNMAKIVLRQRVSMPKADDLDLLGVQDGTIDVSIPDGPSNVFDFAATAAGQTVVHGKMKLHIEGAKLEISFPSSEGASEIDCSEPGLMIDSWEENNCIAPEVFNSAQFSVEGQQVKSLRSKTWGFFVKYPNCYVRLRLDEADRREDSSSFYIRYYLSRDPYFVMPETQ